MGLSAGNRSSLTLVLTLVLWAVHGRLESSGAPRIFPEDLKINAITQLLAGVLSPPALLHLPFFLPILLPTLQRLF